MIEPAATAASRIADPSLTSDGDQAISWVRRHSPVLNGLVRDRLGDGNLVGERVALVVHLEAKTAFLATVLADAGADVVVAGSNPSTTRDDAAASLIGMGIEVHSSRDSGYPQWEEDLLAVADTEPRYIIDDGAELTMRMAKHRPKLFERLLGVSEETTTGVARLRSLDAAGRLPFPAMAANDAACKHMFDNRYGTGQSTVQAILALTNFLMAGQRVAVVGYGWVGRGISNYIRSLGGEVSAIEIDSVKALEAFMDGHQVGSPEQVLPYADIVITATGGIRALNSDHFSLLKPNVVLANAGHHDLEIDVEALGKAASSVADVRGGITRYVWDDKAINVLSHGALVNISGGLGHPIEIMDLSFSVQGLSLHELVVGDYEPGVHVLPTELDDAIATARLESEGIALAHLDECQQDTIDEWIGE